MLATHVKPVLLKSQNIFVSMLKYSITISYDKSNKLIIKILINLLLLHFSN